MQVELSEKTLQTMYMAMQGEIVRAKRHLGDERFAGDEDQAFLHEWVGKMQFAALEFQDTLPRYCIWPS